MENRVIRVAQIIGIANDGGVESCIMNYYKAIDKRKVQFDFFVESTSKIINKERIEEMGGRVIITPSYKNPVKYIRFLKNVFIQNKYDIVHSNLNSLSIFPLKAAKKAGIKIRIAHSHSTSNKKEFIRNFIKNILKLFSKMYATHFFACSEKAGRWLFGNKFFESKKVVIINNAIDIDKFRFNKKIRDDLRKKLDIENKFVIGNIGRFVKQKNQMFLIDIFYEYTKKYNDSCLLIIGDGPLHDQILQKVTELNLNDRVILAGKHENIEDWYQTMDCFILPSLYEGLPVVGVEAQINGLNCIFSSNITKELKINENVEFVSLNSDVKEWINKIESLNNRFNNRELFLEKFVKSKYDIEFEAQKLLKLYYNFVEDVK